MTEKTHAEWCPDCFYAENNKHFNDFWKYYEKVLLELRKHIVDVSEETINSCFGWFVPADLKPKYENNKTEAVMHETLHEIMSLDNSVYSRINNGRLYDALNLIEDTNNDIGYVVNFAEWIDPRVLRVLQIGTLDCKQIYHLLVDFPFNDQLSWTKELKHAMKKSPRLTQMIQETVIQCKKTPDCKIKDYVLVALDTNYIVVN